MILLQPYSNFVGFSCSTIPKLGCWNMKEVVIIFF